MAHIHLQDGTFSLPMTLLWWGVTLGILILCIIRLRRGRGMTSRELTTAGLLTAAAFAVFQVSLPLFGGIHMSMTPLIGILAGPWTGCVVIFLINILSAAIGHGGFGMAGANSVVGMGEVTAGFLVWRVLRGSGASPGLRAGTAAIVALAAGTGLMVGIILFSGIQGVTQSAGRLLAGLTLLAGINLAAAVGESAVTALVVSTLARLRPDLLGERRNAP
jgi:cobalt/nickel transport system permease protein